MLLDQRILPVFLLLVPAAGLSAQAPGPMAPIGVGNVMALQGGPELMDPTTLKFTFPINVRHKTGAGLDFDATLLFNADPSNLFDYNSTNAGVAFTKVKGSVIDLSNVWTLGLTSGNAQPVLNANETIKACGSDHYGNVLYEYTYVNPVFTDKYSVLRQFPYVFVDASECSDDKYYFSAQGPNNSTSATDGSGIYVWGINQPPTAPVFSVYYPDGSSQTVAMNGYAQEQGPPPPASLVLAQDANGNQITTNSAGTSVIDTLGQTVLSGLTISNGAVNSWGTLSYLNSAGTTINTTPGYAWYSVSNINCSGATETSYGASLLDHITLPDGRTYSFTYESTYPNAVSGRLQKVTLPSGGSISYAYSGSFRCSSGPSTLTRTVNDNNGNSSVWTYSLGSNAAGQNMMTMVDPAGTSTVITYTAVQTQTRPDPYPSRSLASSSVTSDSNGNVLSTITTSYVGQGGQSSSVTLPLQSATTTASIPNTAGISSQTVTSYNSVGHVTEVDAYDYGSIGSGSAGPLLSKVVTVYQTTPGPCYAHSGCPPNPGTLPSSVTAYDGAGNMIHKAITTYGTTGLLTQLQQWISGSTYLTTQYGYYVNGQPYSVTDPNGAISYAYYTQCVNPNNQYGGGYLGSTSTAVKNAAGTQTATLTTSETWDCVAGVPTNATDVNGHQSTATYNDPYFRLNSSTDWLGNTTVQKYPTPSSNTSETFMLLNSGSSTSDVLTTYDGLGRPILSQTKQSPSATVFDTVSTTYDNYGRPYSASLPYSAAAGVVNTSIAKSTKTYDSLSRPFLVTDPAGGTTQYTYAANDTLITSGPAPSGENAKKRQLQYNALGQLTSVCEITSGPQSGGCSQNTSATGYLTGYTYDADLLTKISQNIQSGAAFSETRTMNYDGVGRKLSETLPETGSSTYVYDADSSGACSGSSPSDQIKSVDALGNVTCANYDNQHRLLSTAVVAGPYASVTPNLNYVYDAATVNGNAMQGVAGALAEAYTCTGSCASKITDAGFSVSAESSGGTRTGRIVSQLFESTPHSNGYSLTQAVSFPNGTPGSLSGQGSSFSMPSVTYGVDGEGRPATATDGTHSLNLVTATTYNAAGVPTSITIGNGDTDTLGYDSVYRPNGFTFGVAGSSPFSVNGALTLNANSSVKQMSISDTSDASKNQTCTYSADDLNRLKTVNCGSVWNQSFAYDPFGNINKSANGGTTYAATYGANNRVISGTTAGYDASGNQTGNIAGNFGWNAAGQVISTTAGSTPAQATYDALGRMVETVSGSTATQFVYSPLGSQYAVVQNGTLLRGMVPLPGGDTAVYNSAGLNYIRRKDLLGSSRLATTWSHAIYSKDAYAPFGEPYDETATTDRSFTGQGADLTQNVGLYDFQFRKLDTTAGRWLSPDPAGWSAVDLTNPQTLDRYAYVLNNPLTVTDPLGLDPCYNSHTSLVTPSYSAECGYYIEQSEMLYGDALYEHQLNDAYNQAYSAYVGAVYNNSWTQNESNFSEYWNGSSDIASVTVTATLSQSFYGSTYSSSLTQNAYSGGGPGGGIAPSNGTNLFTIPGTNWCGPGGAGRPTTRVDTACYAHDTCYDNAGVSWKNNVGLATTTPQQGASIKGCDAALANDIRNITWKTSAEMGQATIVSTWFNLTSGYSLNPGLPSFPRLPFPAF